MAMKALAIRGPGELSMTEVAEPTARPGEVLVRVQRVGMCGSDLNTYRGKNPMVSYPRILGHEVAGTIAALGPGVAGPWREGVNVTFAPYTNCGTCSSCKAERPNACRNNQTMGVQRDGALTELVAVPAARLHTSERLSLEELALVEPFSVGFHAAARGRARAGEVVLVIGCGGVGLGAIAGAASRGAHVVALDVDDAKLALARNVGAAESINSAREDVALAVKAKTGGEGPPLIIEAVGSPATYRQAIELVAYCGRVVYIGYAKEPVAYETKLFVAKELDILGSRNCLGEFADVIAYFERCTFDLRTLVTRTVALEEVPEAMQAWDREPAAISKLMVRL